MGNRIEWLRVPQLPGIEALFLEDSDRNWRILNTDYCIGASTSWYGEVSCRGRSSELIPGGSLCVAPGEVHSTPTTRRTGNFHSIGFSPAVFDAYLAELEIAPGRAAFRATVAALSRPLLQQLTEVLRLFNAEHTALELQSSVVGLLTIAVPELVENRSRLSPPGHRAAERIRECLHADEGATLSLEQLASAVGLNRFQVLRAFKARYGVAPHAYQICRKVAQARALLKQGRLVADVAAHCGFFDQSHFGRHFKQHLGVTPREYSLASNSALQSRFRVSANAVARHRLVLDASDEARSPLTSAHSKPLRA